MANGKKSFILYTDLIHTVKKMPNDKAGLLLKTILSYVNDENPKVDDLVVDLVFEPIKQQLKRDLQEWEGTRVERSKSGKLGGIKSGETRRKKKQNEANEASASKSKQNEANEAVTVNVTVNGTDTVNNTSILEDNLEVFKKPLVVDGKKESNVYKKCVDFWLKEFHPDWTFDAVQGKSLKSIITKIKKLQEKTGKVVTDELIIEVFQIICKKLPEWYQNKDLQLINSKFNEIITEIKNGNKSNKSKPESKFRS